jgi:hypothetical protein
MSSTVTQPHLQALLKQGALAPLYLALATIF